jgi:hypothetical protein
LEKSRAFFDHEKSTVLWYSETKEIEKEEINSGKQKKEKKSQLGEI